MRSVYSNSPIKPEINQPYWNSRVGKGKAVTHFDEGL